MMVRLINAVTGSDMWVHEDRLEEYLKSGHKLAPAPAVPETKAKRAGTRNTKKDPAPDPPAQDAAEDEDSSLRSE